MVRFGVGDLIDYGNFFLPSGVQSLTISAFIVYDEAPGAFSNRVFGQDNGGASISWGLTLRETPTDTVNKRNMLFVMQTGPGNDLTILESTTQMSPGILYHVAGTYDGSTMRLYFDGVEVASTPKTGSISVENTWNLLIGNRPDGARSFEGLIGDCRTYNRVLSSDEIFALVDSQGDIVLDDGLLFHAPLEGPDGVALSGAESVLDTIGGDFTAQDGGTPTGSPVYEDFLAQDELPKFMNDVYAWLDASEQASMIFNTAQSVTNWADKLGNPARVTTPDGSNPEIDQITVNGLTTINWDDAERHNADFLDGGTGLVGKKYAIFIVEQKRNTGADQWIFGGSDGVTNSNLHIGYRTSNTFSFAQWGNDINATNSAYDTPGVTRLHTLINGATGKTVRLNGTVTGSNSNTQNLLNYNGPEIGRRVASGNNGYAGAICEIIIFDRILSDKEITDLERYLINKWGI